MAQLTGLENSSGVPWYSSYPCSS